jgi:hypothetical protein
VEDRAAPHVRLPVVGERVDAAAAGLVLRPPDALDDRDARPRVLDSTAWNRAPRALRASTRAVGVPRQAASSGCGSTAGVPWRRRSFADG